MTPRRARQLRIENADAPLMTAKKDANDSSPPMLHAEPTESTEPTEPIERIDPADPIDRIEPVEPIEAIEPSPGVRLVTPPV